MVEADVARVKTVLQNVIENSLKYSKNSVQPIEVSLAVDGSDAIIIVRDYGEGIAATEQTKIFEPLQRRMTVA
jgi:signal transduction histidine kinase